MKRIIAIFLSLLFLTGCDAFESYTDPEELCIVSSIGVLVKNGEVVCFIESPDYKGESGKNTVYKSSGKTFKQALSNTSKLFAGKMLYSQCPVILLDDTVDNKVLEDIFKLCLSEYDFSLSMRFLNGNISDLYSEENSEISVGYNILKIINYNDNDKQQQNCGKFSNILNDYKSDGKFFLLHVKPAQKTFVIDGCVLYKKA